MLLARMRIYEFLTHDLYVEFRIRFNEILLQFDAVALPLSFF